MGLRTPGEYLDSLRDSRTVFYRGRRVKDITEDPELRVAVDHAALDFELYDLPDYRDLAVTHDADRGVFSTYFKNPKSSEDLSRRSQLIEASTAHAGTLVTLIHEIGTDALFALQRVLTGEKLERVKAFRRLCLESDLALAVAQTDTKGNRSLSPSQQPDPDQYLRVVSESHEGIVVRGAKVHTSVSANANELIVLPTRSMSDDDADYAVSFAIPVDTEGLSLYVSSYSMGTRNQFEFPISSEHKMLETLTVFNDVFVPWDRVFCCREPDIASRLALTFVEYHRFTAVSYKLPLLDALVGAAGLIVELNGVPVRGHVRDKLVQLIAYVETVRGLIELAAIRCRPDVSGLVYPDPLTTNLAKLTFASRYHAALELVQDLAGGLLVTAPGLEDWMSNEVRPVLEKYLAAASPAEARLRVMHLISDLTARDFGGYQAVLAVHAEGSIEAEKLQLFRSFDPRKALSYARGLAGLTD